MKSLETESGADPSASGDFSVFVAGDAIITQPWSDIGEPAFLKLVENVRTADVAMLNLEMLFHEFKGYPYPIPKGTHLAARPEIANELVWAGIRMVGHANNHAYDYGEIGLFENLENVRKAGLVLAGSGKDLQAARAPAYFRGPKGTVALVAATSSLAGYARATRSRPDLHGKPGVNPLGVYKAAHWLTRRTLTTVDANDLDGNLAAIRDAREKADWVVLSVHAHEQGPWMVRLAHQAIDAGVDLFFGHGPHAVRGVEIYRGRPIFYSLGDFVFQAEQIERLPSEFYERYGLGDDATPDDAQNARTQSGTRGAPTLREIWEGLAARVDFENGKLSRVRLIPVDLGFGQPLPIRGRPKYADPSLGRRIIGDVIQKSRPFGTRIEYRESENIGWVTIPS